VVNISTDDEESYEFRGRFTFGNFPYKGARDERYARNIEKRSPETFIWRELFDISVSDRTEFEFASTVTRPVCTYLFRTRTTAPACWA